jgi:hypothetical protein
MFWCRAQSGTFDQRSFFFFFLKVTVLHASAAFISETQWLAWLFVIRDIQIAGLLFRTGCQGRGFMKTVV